ncbi:MAG: hypothetical protein WC916_01975 [Candidatus Woesearchaeota archaeon]
MLISESIAIETDKLKAFFNIPDNTRISYSFIGMGKRGGEVLIEFSGSDRRIYKIEYFDIIKFLKETQDYKGRFEVKTVNDSYIKIDKHIMK